MIRTKAAYTTTQGICELGVERTNEALKKAGLTYDSWVTMQMIQGALGLSDTLYSFCKVKKGDEAEADTVMRSYMEHTAITLFKYICIADPTYASSLTDPMKAIDKRVKGYDRRPLFAAQYRVVKKLHVTESRPQIKHWLYGIMCLLAEYGNHLCATHASIALMDGADIVGVRQEVHDNLNNALAELLGPDDGKLYPKQGNTGEPS